MQFNIRSIETRFVTFKAEHCRYFHSLSLNVFKNWWEKFFSIVVFLLFLDCLQQSLWIKIICHCNRLCSCTIVHEAWMKKMQCCSRLYLQLHIVERHSLLLNRKRVKKLRKLKVVVRVVSFADFCFVCFEENRKWILGFLQEVVGCRRCTNWHQKQLWAMLETFYFLAGSIDKFLLLSEHWTRYTTRWHSPLSTAAKWQLQ